MAGEQKKPRIKGVSTGAGTQGTKTNCDAHNLGATSLLELMLARSLLQAFTGYL